MAQGKSGQMIFYPMNTNLTFVPRDKEVVFESTSQIPKHNNLPNFAIIKDAQNYGK